MSNKIKNMAALIKDLSIAYEQLRSKKIDLAEAKEIANLSGKLIKGATAQLNYNELMKSLTPIEFFEP